MAVSLKKLRTVDVTFMSYTVLKTGGGRCYQFEVRYDEERRVAMLDQEALNKILKRLNLSNIDELIDYPAGVDGADTFDRALRSIAPRDSQNKEKRSQ